MTGGIKRSYPAGPLSEPPRAGGETTVTWNAANRKRTFGFALSERTGSEPSTGNSTSRADGSRRLSQPIGELTKLRNRQRLTKSRPSRVGAMPRIVLNPTHGKRPPWNPAPQDDVQIDRATVTCNGFRPEDFTSDGSSLPHIALGLGLAACQKGLAVGFTTAAALVHELMEARDEKRLLRLQKQLAKVRLLIIDELGFVPLSKTGAELLFEVFSQRYERGAIVITSNLPFDEWTEIFGSERLTGALLDRLTHHVHILEMNGDSYRLNQSRRKQQTAGRS